MHFQIFTLQPDIFRSFFDTSLIARGLAQNVFTQHIIDWRSHYGVGNHRQVDDRPYGGSHGMVLQADPIYRALTEHNALSILYHQPPTINHHIRRPPNNEQFEQLARQTLKEGKKIPNVTILLTPQGYSYNQSMAEWIAQSFEQVSLVCGRYEGFDARVNDCVDLEISLGDYILNGGEVAAMAVIESIARLLPGFLVKEHTAEHDSYSTKRMIHRESMEYIVGKKRLSQSSRLQEEFLQEANITQLFSTKQWQEEVLLYIEYPHYTRPEIWQNARVPEVLLGGDHKKIDNWRKNWYR